LPDRVIEEGLRAIIVSVESYNISGREAHGEVFTIVSVGTKTNVNDLTVLRILTKVQGGLHQSDESVARPKERVLTIKAKSLMRERERERERETERQRERQRDRERETERE
jgi:hypothetical protein